MGRKIFFDQTTFQNSTQFNNDLILCKCFIIVSLITIRSHKLANENALPLQEPVGDVGHPPAGPFVRVCTGSVVKVEW